VNLAMRGVFVRPGTHRIVLSYAPPGWKLGITLSMISLLLLAVFLFADRLHRRSPLKA
jgi:uncharacterized membrane protein YfhO